MRWVITEDLTEEPDAVGIGNYPLDGPLAVLPQRFQLLDDDGLIYYRGRSDDAQTLWAFTPLDWAESFAGCTAIQFWQDGAWQTL